MKLSKDDYREAWRLVKIPDITIEPRYSCCIVNARWNGKNNRYVFNSPDYMSFGKYVSIWFDAMNERHGDSDD